MSAPRLIAITAPRGYSVDPDRGLVFNSRGSVVGWRNRKGYVQVSHQRQGFGNYVHRMVWEAVNGPIPDGLEINHKNGVKDDNRIENLELVTRSENALHMYATGLRPRVFGRDLPAYRAAEAANHQARPLAATR